jgi:hypothetical protein
MMKMNKKPSLRLTLSASLSTLAVLAAFGTGAQAAEPSHRWIPAGEAVGDEISAPSTAGSATREDVAAETLQARRAGRLTAAGEASGEGEQRADASRPPSVARSEVKAETLAAVHNRTIAPFGEAASFGDGE